MKDKSLWTLGSEMEQGKRGAVEEIGSNGHN